MYRIMIVDDEPTIRKGLINFIDWNSMDCDIVCELADGIEAKEYFATGSVDIVIADIKMPGLDGIGLSRYIYENNRNVKVIILTGYADFEYARSAIKYGIVDFILKPTNTEKILQAVDKAKTIIKEQRVKENTIKNLEQKIYKNDFERKENAIRNLFTSAMVDPILINERLESLNIKLENFYILISEIDQDQSELPQTSKDKKRYIDTLKNVISLGFKNYTHYSVEIESYKLCTLLSVSKNDHQKYIQIIINTCEEIIDMIENFMSYTTSIGVSHMHSDSCEIFQAFKEAEESLSFRFYNESKILIHLPHAVSGHRIKSASIGQYIDSIFEHVQHGKTQEATDEVYQMFKLLKNSKQPIEYIKDISILLSSLCSRLLQHQNISLSDVIDDNINIYSDILECKTLKRLTEMVKNVIVSVSNYFSHNERQVNYIIDTTVNYIQNHYHENIRLNSIAEYVHVNPSYLSRLFKKETGETLTEAITIIRIEKAKKLILQTDMKIYEIAVKVGIEDPAYFSQLFKKYTGHNPKEYKRML